MERVYYKINEMSAKQAHNMMSFSDYKMGSKTVEYRGYVNKAYELADRVATARPNEADRAYRLAQKYSKKLAENMNASSHIGCMCPSVMISGAGNFPIKKKEKQNAAVDRNYQQFNEIQNILHKLESILYCKEIIKSDDEMAIEKLEEKLEHLKEQQEIMKRVNLYYRKNKTLEDCPELTEKEIKQLKEEMEKDWHPENKPFASYILSNNNQNIHATEERLKRLKATKEKGTQKMENEFFRIVENTEIMRLQIFFDEKPKQEVRNILKSNGFKWSPKNICWQRQLTNNAKYSVKRVIQELKEIIV